MRAFLRLWLRNRNGNGTESSRTRRNQLLSLAETQQPILEILTIVLGHANQVVNDPVMYFWCFIDMTISFYWQCCQLCVFFGQKTEIYLWRNVELNFETRWTKMQMLTGLFSAETAWFTFIVNSLIDWTHIVKVKFPNKEVQFHSSSRRVKRKSIFKFACWRCNLKIFIKLSILNNIFKCRIIWKYSSSNELENIVNKRVLLNYLKNVNKANTLVLMWY